MARIRRFTSRIDAEVAASMLRAHGIDAVVRNDDSGGMHPNLAFALSGTEVIVPDEQLEEATTLLDTAEHTVVSEPPDEGPAPRRPSRRAWLRVVAVLVLLVGVTLALAGELDLLWY